MVGKRLQGFTLIELVVVLTIVGILAAVALPRFVNLQRDARIAKLNASKGAIGAASALVHSIFLARAGVADPAACPGGGGTANNTSTVCTENGLVAITNGYPSAIATAGIGAGNPGIIGASGLIATFNPTVAQLAAEGYVVTGTAAAQTIQIQGAAALANCQVVYTAPAAANAAPSIVSDASNC